MFTVGSRTTNAKLFKQGYDSVLNPLYSNGTLVKAKAGDQWTDWDPITGRQIFDQILAPNNNDVMGSIAAKRRARGRRDCLAQGHGEKPIPLTGQDAPHARAVHPRRADRAELTSMSLRP